MPGTRLDRGSARPTGRYESDGDGSRCCENEGVENRFHIRNRSEGASGTRPTGCPANRLRLGPRVRPGAECEAKSGENPALSRNCEALRG